MSEPEVQFPVRKKMNELCFLELVVSKLVARVGKQAQDNTDRTTLGCPKNLV